MAIKKIMWRLCHLKKFVKRDIIKKNFVVIGVAYGKTEAIDLFCYIIQQAVEKDSDMQKAEEWIL